MGSYISGRKKQGVKSRGTGSLNVAEFSSLCLWSVNLFLNIAVQFNLFPKGSQNFKKHKTLRLRVRGRKVVGRREKTTYISKSIIQIKLGRAGSRSAVVVVSITICHTKRRYWNHLSYSSVQCTPPEGTYFVSLDSKGNLYRSNWKTLK